MFDAIPFRTTAPWLIGALLVGACGGSPVLDDDPPPASPPPVAVVVTLTATALGLEEGGVATLQATVRDASGTPIEGRAITWQSDDPTIATVSTDGRVTAIAEGTTRIRARHAALEAVGTVQVQSLVSGILWYATTEAGAPIIHRVDARGGQPAPVWPTPGAWQPAVSTDGTRLAFTCNEPGPAICVANIDGSGLRVLTGSDRANEDEPAWSPDGLRIVFRRWPHGASPGPFNPTDLWVMDADGGNQVNVTLDAGVQHRPAWSPVPIAGSYRIAFAQEAIVDGFITSRIATMRPDGSDRRFATDGGLHEELAPAWSPDARTILFTRVGGEVDDELYRVDLATGAEHPLLPTPLAGSQRHPVWSPDGRYVVFTSNHEPTSETLWRMQLYTVRADGTQLTRRTAGIADATDPVWGRRP